MADDKSKGKSTTTIREQWEWQVQYSRCFTHPSSYLSNNTAIAPPLSPRKGNPIKPIWISTFGSSTVSLHPSADGSSSDSIITVSLQGTLIEEHFVSKLHFTWPQVSCVSGFPARGSLAILANYTDSADEKQKFALRFSTVSEVEDFVNSLEDIFLSKIPKGSPAVNVLPAISSESEFVPPYRPDRSVMSPTYASPVPNHSPTHEDCQDSQVQDRGAESESNVSAFPPRFTSLVSNCSTETEQGNLTLALPSGSKDLTIRAQIAKYMQDTSFLDIVDKVNEVISELGENFVL